MVGMHNVLYELYVIYIVYIICLLDTYDSFIQTYKLQQVGTVIKHFKNLAIFKRDSIIKYHGCLIKWMICLFKFLLRLKT